MGRTYRSLMQFCWLFELFAKIAFNIKYIDAISALLATQHWQVDAQLKLHLNFIPLPIDPSRSSSSSSEDGEAKFFAG